MLNDEAATTTDGDDPARYPDMLDALREIHDPCSVATGIAIDIVDMGLIGSVRRNGATIEIGLCLTSPACWQAVGMAAAIEAALLRLEGVDEVRCVPDLAKHWMPDRMDPGVRARLREVRSYPAPRAGASLRPGDA